MQEINSYYTIRNVQKALELLEQLAESEEMLTLRDLAERIEFSTNKTFRLLATLSEKGLVERDETSGLYRLGARTASFGRKLVDNCAPVADPDWDTLCVVDSSNLVTYSHPVMKKLARKYDEAVYMTVIKDNQVLFLNMVDCEHLIKAEPLVGKKFPFFTNAAGKVMKAVDSWDLLEKICNREKRSERRPNLSQLAAELEQARATGVAVDKGGLGEDIISVAVAVRDYAGKVVGAITMLGPSFRMLAERIDNEIIPAMLEEAAQLSLRFGYAPG